MILHRCFAWDERAGDKEPDGPLWFPRVYQGEGRHDNPDAYGCVYLADRPVSCIAEQLAAFRGQRMTASLLRRRGLPLALAEIDVDSGARLIDLAAFLDRVERAPGEDDFRLRSFRAALRHLSESEPDKAKAVLTTLSDPTTEHLDHLDNQLPWLRERVRPGHLGVTLVGRSAYPPAEVAERLAVPAWAHLPRDRWGAGVLAGRMTTRAWTRTRLAQALRALAAGLAHLTNAAVEVRR